MSLYNLHYLEFMATSHDKFWSHPRANATLTILNGWAIIMNETLPDHDFHRRFHGYRPVRAG